MAVSVRSVFRGDARWPYVVAVTSAALASLGLVYAPISGIVYALGLPGLLVVAAWALSHRDAAGRQAFVLSAVLMTLGLLVGIAAVLLTGRVEAVRLLSSAWYDGMLIGAMLLLPLTSIVLAVIGSSYGLGRGSLRRRGAHVVDLRP